MTRSLSCAFASVSCTLRLHLLIFNPFVLTLIMRVGGHPSTHTGRQEPTDNLENMVMHRGGTSRRRRNNGRADSAHDGKAESSCGHEDADSREQQVSENKGLGAGARDNLEGSFFLTRVVFLRYLAFLLLNGFLIAYNQNDGLLGSNGLTPYQDFLHRALAHFGSKKDAFCRVPSLFWLFPPHYWTDGARQAIEMGGIVLSTFVLFSGSANVPILLYLWMAYMSLVNVGGTWYSFGWETQILENTWLAALGVPLLSLRRYAEPHTSWVARWSQRWLLFRLMVGAGLIKIRGDSCWRNLTCMFWHYETQPVPSPTSFYFHHSSEIWHKFEVLSNHIVELGLPYFLLLPGVFIWHLVLHAHAATSFSLLPHDILTQGRPDGSGGCWLLAASCR